MAVRKTSRFRRVSVIAITAVVVVALVAAAIIWYAVRVGSLVDSPPTHNATVSGDANKNIDKNQIPPPSQALIDARAQKQQIQDLLQQMTPEQKAAQLVMVGVNSTVLGNSEASIAARNAVDSLILRDGVGGIVYLGNGWVGQEVVKNESDHVISLTPNGLPQPYIAADQEGGEIQRISGDGFDVIPPATVQGTRSAEELTSQANVWGTQLKHAGVNLDLAPVADSVPAGSEKQSASIGTMNRQFGSAPDVTGAHAAAFIDGMNQAGELTAVKHFPGLGRIAANTDFSASGITDTVTSATDTYIDAYRQAIAAHPSMVMVSLATYTKIDPDDPAAFSSAVIADLLRGQLGWDGVVISDSMNAAAVSEVPANQRLVRFVEAGGDIAIITSPADALAAINGTVEKMQSSSDFSAEVDASVTRVLTQKQSAGLL